MEGVDIYATKGIEYIFILGFLAILVFFWQALNKGNTISTKANTENSKSPHWFPLVRDLYYHQGHTWVHPQADGTVHVGLDLLACKLLGAVKKINVVTNTDSLCQGCEVARVEVNGYSVPLVSPVDGELLAKNDNGCTAAQRPREVNDIQWLFKVKPKNLKANLNNLLSGDLASRWREETEKLINSNLTGNLGMVLQDGGEIENGFIFSLPEAVREELMCKVFLAEDLKKN